MPKFFREYRDLRWQGHGNFLKNQTVPTVTDWMYIGGLRPVMLIVGGAFTGNVKLHIAGQGEADKPGDPTHYPTLGDPMTAPDSRLLDAGIGWIALNVVSVTGTLESADVWAG